MLRVFSFTMMEFHGDFLEFLDQDVSTMILMGLDDPADIVRASSVSRLWRDFGEHFFVLILVSCFDCFVCYDTFLFLSSCILQCDGIGVYILVQHMLLV